MAGIRIGQQAFPGDFVRKDSVDKRVLSQLSGVPFLPNYAIFEKNGTFVVPSGVERVLVLVIGGGGSGGGTAVEFYEQKGGAGGNLCSGICFIAENPCINVVVGTGGKGTIYKGAPGGSSSFGSFITCSSGTSNGITCSDHVNILLSFYGAPHSEPFGAGGGGCAALETYMTGLTDSNHQFNLASGSYGGNGRYTDSVGRTANATGFGNGTGDDPLKLYLLAMGSLPGGTGRGGGTLITGFSNQPAHGFGGGGGAGTGYSSDSYYQVSFGGSGGGENGERETTSTGSVRGGNGAPGVVCVFW